ncbi:MAG: sulfite exporter TauE/SafE family protein [Alkalispirochaeta sp.]
MTGIDAVPFPLVLTLAFFVTAVLYSTAGFGGGSTYSAILLGVRVPAPIVPLISLPANIVVSGTGFLRALRRDLVPVRLLFSILIVSVPAAFVGGVIPISRELFLVLLAVVLLYAGTASLYTGARTEFFRHRQDHIASGEQLDLSRAGEVQLRIIVAGALIGFVSGLVGIGGGIMLSPILQRERILSPQRVSALSAGFILFNSVAALAGKVTTAVNQGIPGTEMAPEVVVLSASILVAVVLTGGIIGSGIAIRGLTAGRLRLITGLLLVSVSLRVLV